MLASGKEGETDAGDRAPRDEKTLSENKPDAPSEDET